MKNDKNKNVGITHSTCYELLYVMMFSSGRTNLTIEEQINLSKKPFKKAMDLFELSKQQTELFEFETDCFCKAT